MKHSTIMVKFEDYSKIRSAKCAARGGLSNTIKWELNISFATLKFNSFPTQLSSWLENSPISGKCKFILSVVCMELHFGIVWYWVLRSRGLKTLYLLGGTQKSSGRKTHKSLSRHTEKVPNHLSRPTIFWTVRTHFGLSGHNLSCPETSWTFRTYFELSGYIFDLFSRLVFRRPWP